MRNIKGRVLVLITIISIVACKKEEAACTCPTTSDTGTDNSIVYPDSVYYGKNVLTFPDSTIVDTLKDYSFGAILGKDATLKLKITRLAPRQPGVWPPKWGFMDNPAWWLVLRDPSGGGDSIETFIAVAHGKIDLKIEFYRNWQDGKCRIDFYENSTSITKTKYLKW